jgi:hypothetical protein
MSYAEIFVMRHQADLIKVFILSLFVFFLSPMIGLYAQSPASLPQSGKSGSFSSAARSASAGLEKRAGRLY